MQFQTLTTQGGRNYWILEPPSGHVIRPVVLRRSANAYFQAVPGLQGLINGTFFYYAAEDPHELTVLGDIKTDWALFGDFTEKPFFHQGDSFWTPAATVQTPLRYRNRCALAVAPDGARIVPGQPGQYATYSNDKWVMGGGALLVHQGVAVGTKKKLTSTAGGQFSGQLADTRHALLLVAGDGRVHLGMNADSAVAAAIGVDLVGLGYREAVMLDGGGAATFMYRDDDHNLQAKVIHNPDSYPVLHSVMGILEA